MEIMNSNIPDIGGIKEITFTSLSGGAELTAVWNKRGSPAFSVFKPDPAGGHPYVYPRVWFVLPEAEG